MTLLLGEAFASPADPTDLTVLQGYDYRFSDGGTPSTYVYERGGPGDSSFLHWRAGGFENLALGLGSRGVGADSSGYYYVLGFPIPPDPLATYVIGFAMRFRHAPNRTDIADDPLGAIYNWNFVSFGVGGALGLGVSVSEGNYLVVRSGAVPYDSLDGLVWSTRPVIRDDVWHFVEVAVSHAALGVRIAIDGDIVIEQAGLDIRADHDEIYIGHIGGRTPNTGWATDWIYEYDDVYISVSDDATMGTVFLGSGSSYTLRPEAAGAHTDFVAVPDGTPNYSDVNDGGHPDGDATNVTTSSAGSVDTYQMTDLPDSGDQPTEISAVQLNFTAKAVLSAAKTLTPIFRQGSAEAAGLPVTVPGQYGTVAAMFDKNPLTNAPWTVEDLNDVTSEFGFRSGSLS